MSTEAARAVLWLVVVLAIIAIVWRAARRGCDRRVDRGAQMLVWAAWAGMLGLLLWFYIPASSPIPLAEDWYTVPLLTGQPVDLPAWLWEQNNEHRMPVARLLLLGVLKAAGGDHRAGGLLNMALLAAGAAGLILVARRVRGRTDVADAFFPLTLLNFGHSVDVLFPFQITFVLSLALILLVGCTLFLPGSLATTSGSAVAGGALLLLPLSGFIGMAFVAAMAAYLFYAGWCCRVGVHGWPQARGTGTWLMAAAGGSLLLAALYFVGYEHPWWNPPNPGVVPSVKIVLKLLALGFGAAAYSWWPPGVVAAVIFLAASSGQAVRRVVRGGHIDYRALGPALFLGNGLAFVAAVGWGRAGYAPEIGIPLRYVSIALPAFIAAYLIWTASSSRTALMIQRGLALTVLILLPVNTAAGHRQFADWYHDGMTRIQADLDAGTSIEELAERHQPFLVHWWSPEELARHMRMLHEAGVPPFDRSVEALPKQ